MAVEELILGFFPKWFLIADGEGFVKSEFECVIYKIRYEAWQVVVNHTKIGVGVDLNKPDSEVLIDQKVETHELEAVIELFRIQVVNCRHKAVDDQILDSWKQVILP